MSIASRLFCSNDIGKSYSFSFNDNNKKGSQHKRNNGWQPLYAEHHFILKTQGNCAIIATFEKKKKDIIWAFTTVTYLFEDIINLFRWHQGKMRSFGFPGLKKKKAFTFMNRSGIATLMRTCYKMIIDYIYPNKISAQDTGPCSCLWNILMILIRHRLVSCWTL